MKEILKNRTIIIIGAIIVVLAIIITIIVFNIIPQQKPSNNYHEFTDEASGETLYIADTEPERGVGKLELIGFRILYDVGFSSTQRAEITKWIHDYFTEHYPDVFRISYLKDSFGYSNDYFHSYFKVVPDTGEEYIITVDTSVNKNEPAINISRDN